MYKVIRLKNGLRLITAPLHETRAVTVLVLVKVGSRLESHRLNGVSHFIEHLMFKGTGKRPTTLDLSRELDSVGAEYNAFTGKDHTGYYIKVQAGKLELAIDMLADMLFHSKFDSQEINRERGTIIEEINMYEDNPLLLAPAFLEEAMFGRASRLGQLIVGSKRNISSLTRTAMLQYKDAFYNPANMVVGVCGDVVEKRVLDLIKKYFSGRNQENNKLIKASEPQASKRNKSERSERNKSEASDSEPSAIKANEVNAIRAKANEVSAIKVALKRKDTQQVQLCLGFFGYSYAHKDRYVLDLLNVILGGNMSSRLFIEVRERRGLCYFIRSAVNPYQDTGSFIIQAGLDKVRLSEAMGVIIQELKRIVASGVTAEELQKAKDYVKGRVVLDFEDSQEIIDFYTRQLLLLDEIETVEQKIRQVERVTLTDIKRVARDVLNIKQSTLALIGPFTDKRRFLRVLQE